MDTNFEHNRGRRGGKGGRNRRDPGASRPYRFALFTDPEGGYILRSPDLPGRSVGVDSLQEVGAAVQSAVDVRTAEIEAEAEQDEGLYSGKFVLRLPRTLHRQLAELAVEEGVSLNQLALTFLAEGMGRVDSAQDFNDNRRGPRGSRPGPRGPHGGRARRGFRHDRGEGNPEERFGARGHDFSHRKHEGRGHRRPHFSGRFPDIQPETRNDPDSPRLV